MADWKASERVTAKLLGSRRNPNNGEHRTDIDTPVWAVEHKKRETFPAWLEHGMDQAVRAAQPEQTPIVVVAHHRGRGFGVRRYVVMRIEDFVAWHGDVKEGEE